MDINKMTVKDFRKLEPFGEDAEFNGIVLVPCNDVHESGFRMMRFVLLYDHKIVGVIDRGSDVLHINGIGGYGLNYKEAMKTQKVRVVGWQIDCLSNSGLMRIFTNKTCIVFGGYSDFQIVVKDDSK